MNCNVPQRTGYQVIYAVWEIADTSNSFYQAIDVDFGSGERRYRSDQRAVLQNQEQRGNRDLPRAPQGDVNLEARVMNHAGAEKGYVKQDMNNANQYEPGVGSHWSMAWTLKN
jgi:predicted carbohydrate-binding protein with CBM5 and CBM33 domain